MKNIKKALLYAVFTPVMMNVLGMGSSLGKEAAKELATASVEVAKITAVASVDVTKIAAKGAVESSEKVALAATKELAPYIGAAVCIYGLKESAYVAADLYDYFKPDEEKQERIKEAREKNEFYDAKRELRGCIMQNNKGQRSEFGTPQACDNLVRKFILVAGRNAFNDMAENFKAAYGEE